MMHEFHGDASAQDIIDADESTIHIWMERYDQSRKDWESFMTGYVPEVIRGFINSSVNIVTLWLLTGISQLLPKKQLVESLQLQS
jgi:hypothetical protein